MLAQVPVCVELSLQQGWHANGFQFTHYTLRGIPASKPPLSVGNVQVT